MVVTKDQMLYWMRRHVRHLEGDKPNMEEMARKGIPYEERQKMIAQWEKTNLDQQQQIECFNKAIELVERHG